MGLRERPIPGFSVPRDQLLLEAARNLNEFLAQLAPADAALKSQRQTNEDPLIVLPLALDDSNCTPSTASQPNLIEINNPHQSLYFQDSNSLSAYFWYRPIDKAYDRLARWIKVRKGDTINWPFPVQKAYIWYPQQDLLTATVLLLKYGEIKTATVNTISLNAGSGSSIVTNPFDVAADQPSVAIPAGGAATPILTATATRTKIHLYNDAGGDIVWIGDSNVAAGTRGFPLAPGEGKEITNVGPLYGSSLGGSTIYGMEERQ